MPFQIEEIHLKSIDSTHLWAKRHLHEFDQKKITCITAEEQSNGRGRYDRKWFSPPNKNLYVTFVFTVEKNKDLQVLTSLLSLSCIKVLLQYPLQPKIKWPNDIFLNNRKIGGVLCELIHDAHHINVILGLGLNINISQKDLNHHVGDVATSIYSELNQETNRTQIFNCLKNFFHRDLILFLEKGFSPFHQLFASFLRELGQEVYFKKGQNSIRATCHSVSPTGQLNLRQANGNMITTFSDQITLIGPPSEQ